MLTTTHGESEIGGLFVGMIELGRQINQVRHMKKLSLHAVAESAEISPTYLQKLEAGSVKAPSPPVLQRLAKALDLSYPGVMETAGYLEPSDSNGGAQAPDNLLAQALMGEALSAEEAQALAHYLAFIRQRRTSGG
jgi:transcriptional regulator with XRE-family HTH domain